MNTLKKKLIFITPGYMPINNNYGGGIESLIRKYFEHNEKTKLFDITAYSAYGKEDTPDNSNDYNLVNFHNINISKKYNKLSRKIERLLQVLFGTPCARPYIKEVIKQINNDNYEYDLIIIENCENDLAYISDNIKRSAPIVLHLHNDYVNKKRKDAKKCINFLTQIWGVSNFIQDQVNKIDNGSKAITIYNSIDMDSSENRLSKSERQRIRNILNIKDDDYVFIYCGRIMAEKGVKELVQAFTIVNKKRRNTKLLLLGGSKSNDKISHYYNKIRAISNKNDSIRMLGRIDNKELKKYYQISDCQVIPSKWNEAFGLVALEGQEYGLLQIVSNWGGLVEVVKDTDYIPINKCNKKEIAKKMLEALNYNHKKTQVSKKKFSEERYTKSIDEAIIRIIENR